MTAQANLIGGTASLGSDGWRHTVRYLVLGEASEYAAILATVPHGTPDGTIPGIFALDFDCTPASEASIKQWHVTVTYRRFEPGSTQDNPPDPTPSGGVIQVGSRVQAATFQHDISNNQITTQHTYNTTTRQETVTQPAEVEGFVPSTVLTIERTENSSPTTLAKIHVGTVNNDSFNGDTPRKWLCTGIEGISEDNGTTYRVTYEFEFRSETWDAKAIFIDDETGHPPAGIGTGAPEIETYQIYPRTNFSGMSLGL